jgi:hypothetical protein
MCIYGVTRIGTGSLGASRFLPALVTTLQATKPLLVFLCGAWFVLYLLNRQTKRAPLRSRLLLLLAALGFLAVVDASAEAAYLLIPKQEEFPAVGCCVDAFSSSVRASRFVPQALVGERYEGLLYIAYYAANLGMPVAILALLWRGEAARTNKRTLTRLCLGAASCVAVSALFLIEIAAPILLHFPGHHCPYDLLPQAPQSMAAIVLFVLATFAVGWATLARWLADVPESLRFVTSQNGKLLRLAMLGYLGSTATLSLELALA